MAVLDRHLWEKGSIFSILKDQEFYAGCKVLWNGEANELQEKAHPVTDEEEELSRQVLGADTGMHRIPLLHCLDSTIVESTLGARVVHCRLILK